MRGRKRIISLIAVLSVILVFSGVFASGVIDVSKLSLLGGGVEPLSPDITLFVDPVAYADWTKDVGDTVQLHINISSTGNINLFSWQLNVTWDPAVLNASRILPGEFLNRTTSPHKTASHKLKTLGKPQMNKTDNVRGYSAFSDSILGDVVGINGSGRLATIEFKVAGYGNTTIDISLTGTHRTRLLNRGKADIALSSGDLVSGYFRNKWPGDVNGDGIIGGADYSILSDYWTDPAGPYTQTYGYNIECDFEEAGVSIFIDGVVDGSDFSLMSDWWTDPKGPSNPDP